MHLTPILMPHPQHNPFWDLGLDFLVMATTPLCLLSFKSILMSSCLTESCFSYSLDPGKRWGNSVYLPKNCG